VDLENQRDSEKLVEMASLLSAVLEFKRIEEIKKFVASTIVDFDIKRDSEKPSEMSSLIFADLERVKGDISLSICRICVTKLFAQFSFSL